MIWEKGEGGGEDPGRGKGGEGWKTMGAREREVGEREAVRRRRRRGGNTGIRTNRSNASMKKDIFVGGVRPSSLALSNLEAFALGGSGCSGCGMEGTLWMTILLLQPPSAP